MIFATRKLSDMPPYVRFFHVDAYYMRLEEDAIVWKDKRLFLLCRNWDTGEWEAFPEDTEVRVEPHDISGEEVTTCLKH